MNSARNFRIFANRRSRRIRNADLLLCSRVIPRTVIFVTFRLAESSEGNGSIVVAGSNNTITRFSLLDLSLSVSQKFPRWPNPSTGRLRLKRPGFRHFRNLLSLTSNFEKCSHKPRDRSDRGAICFSGSTRTPPAPVPAPPDDQQSVGDSRGRLLGPARGEI